MMEKIRDWFIRNYNEINWFIIGWCSMSFLHSLQRGDLIGALLNAALVVFNYSLSKR